MKAKITILLLITLLLSLSFATAESFILDESRTRIAYDPPGDNDELMYSGFSDVYIMKSGSLTLERIENNFTTFTVFYSTGTNTDDFFAFHYNGSAMYDGGNALTYPSLMVTSTGTDTVRFWEMNVFGVNDVNNVNPLNLNDVTPLAHHITLINGMEFDTQTNFLYVLYNNSNSVNVYDISKPALWDASWVRTFQLAQNCGYTDQNKQDIEILNNQFYLLCGDSLQVPDRTVYSYTLLGDFRDTYTLNTLDNDYHSITYTEAQDELVAYDNTDNEIVFFEFQENTILGDGVVIIGGQAYNTTGLCINDDQFSTNVSIFTNQFGDVFFDSQNEYVTWCSAGCVNIQDTNNVTQGLCQQNACNNECNDPDFDFCETPNTYATCSVGNDGCTDLNSGLFCPANQICEDTEIGAQCLEQDLDELGGLYVQPFISIDITANYTNAYEVLETEIDRTVDLITIPTLSTTLGIGVERVTNLFVKSFAETLFSEIKITGIQQLQPTNYYALSCDWTDNYLELDYLDTVNDLTTGNTIQNESDLYYLDIDTLTTKTLEPTSLSQNLELLVKPLTNGKSYITYKDGSYGILQLEIDYNNVTNNLLIRETGFNKLFVNETDPNSDTLSRIAISTTHIKEADTNNIELVVIREVNDIETEQIYYSLPISYYSGIASTPDTVEIHTENNTQLRLYQIIQREQSGFPVYDTNEIQTCEYTNLECVDQVAFVNDRNTQTYYFKEKLVTCVNQLGNVLNADPGDQPPTEFGELDFFEQIRGKPFTQDQKVLVAGIVLALVFAVFIYGYVETRQNIVLVGGSVITGIFTLWFVTIGYLPAWIILLLIAIGGLLVVGMFRGGD